MKIENLFKMGFISVTLSSALLATQSTKLDSVIVTANKLEQNVQEIPQSISIIDEVTIEDRGLDNIKDVVKLIPNMSLSADSGQTVNFRGLNTSQFTNTNPVAIYVDGVPTTDKYGYDLFLENIQRVEVLRGPQGTLYGKNAIGGVINVVTKKPTNLFVGDVGIEYGSDNNRVGKFNLSGPITKDKFYYSLSGKVQKDDGWIKNNYPGMDEDANRKENSNFNGSLYYKNDRLSSKLTLAKYKNKRYWFDGYSVPKQMFTSIGDFKRDKAKNVSFDTETLEYTKSFSQNLNIKYNFDNFTLDSITTNKKLEYSGIDDLDYSILPQNKFLDDTTTKTLSQELRLSSDKNDNLKWVSGLFYDKEDRDQGPYGMSFFNIVKNSTSNTKTDTKAIFSQVMIPYNDFEFTLGARYQKIDKDFDVTTTSSIAPTYSISTKRSWNTFIPKLGVTYKLNENITPFISISKGYLPGGFNYVADSGSVGDNSFEPQKSTNYELGFKSNFDDFVLSGSIFRMNIEDIHVYKIQGSIVTTENAKKAHSQGIELEGTYFVNDNFEISTALGFIDAKYDEYYDGKSFDGQKIRKTPNHTASIAFSYKNPNGFYSILDINNKGAMEVLDQAKREQVKLDSYTIANLKVGYKIRAFDIYAFANNLTDEEYLTSLNVPPLSYNPEFGEPRKFGVGIKYSF